MYYKLPQYKVKTTMEYKYHEKYPMFGIQT